MAEKSKKLKSNKRKIISREPYKRPSEAEKQKIVYEVTKGLIGIRAACRKYGVNRNTLKNAQCRAKELPPPGGRSQF